MTDLPWHEGDHAITPDGDHLHVISIEDGQPSRWYHDDVGFCSVYTDSSNDDVWPTDATPDFTHRGTAAAWLKSCAGVVPRALPHGAWTEDTLRLGEVWHIARSAIIAAHPRVPWDPHDTTLIARAVDATQAYRASPETR